MRTKWFKLIRKMTPLHHLFNTAGKDTALWGPSVINFNSMRSTLANVWHPLGGFPSLILVLVAFYFDSTMWSMQIGLMKVAIGPLIHTYRFYIGYRKMRTRC
ncbi:hypothetical protein V6N13_131632 [Hibiscus sabdariffa]